MNLNIWKIPFVIQHAKLIAFSYKYWTGKDLFPGKPEDYRLSEALYLAPYIVVSHGIEKDPIFNYANLSAQKLWKIEWDAFTKMPSRLSAEPVEENKRNQLLEEGKKKGVTFLKQVIRIDNTGRKFYIEEVVLFNLIDKNKNYLGQGAVYEKWKYLN